MKNLAKNRCFLSFFFHIFCLLGYNLVTFSLGFACKNTHMTPVTLLSETQLGEEHFNTNEVHWRFSNMIGLNVALHYKQT